MKYARPRAAIATGLCLLMAAGPVAPAAFAVDADSAGQQPYAEPADPAEAAEAAEVITVLFDAYGGAFSSGATFLDIATQADGTVVFPENPTREGYYFAGWTYDSAGTKPFVEGTKLDRHTNLYAQWNKQAAAFTTVLFDANGGAFSSGATFLDIATQDDGTVVFPENPTREGYDFAGWTYDSAGTKPFVEGTKLDRHTNLYAQWNKQDVPVQEDVTYTFKDVDGTVLGSVTYTYEQVLAGVYNWAVVAPDKPGYEFAGWCVEGTDYVIDPATVAGPQSDTTFFAKWNKVETPMQEPVTYTFVDEDGVTVLGSVTYDYAQIVAGLYNWDVVKPVKEGYEFAGWCVEGTDYVIDPSVVAAPQHDQTFVAKWSKAEAPVQEPVTYTFVDEDGTVLGDVTYSYEQVLEGVFNWDVVTPADKPGYEFAGWCVEGTDYVIDPATVAGPQSDTTFFAKWNKVETPMQEPVTYTFVDEDGTVLGDVTYSYEQVLEGVFNWDVVEPSKEGYEFAGWCVEGADYVIDPAFVAGPQHDQTFVAKWNKVEAPVQEDVTYTFVDEDWTVLGSVTYTYEQALEGVYNWDVVEPSKEGYEFVGWCYEGTDYVVDPAAVAGPQHDATFVAKWEKIGDPVEQDVTFTFYDEDQTTVLGDVTYPMSQIEAGVYNWNVVTPAPRDGYVFEGWSYMGSDAIIDFTVTRAPNTDQSLVAHWKAVDPQVVTHKVTFSDGIDATNDTVVEVEDGKTVARPGDPTLAGYKFLGWTLDKQTMELYDFATPVTADITLYGVWQKVAVEAPGADENQAQGENGNAEGSNAEPAKADEEAQPTTLPQTSDGSMMLVGAAAAAGVAALGAGAYALRRRNEQR